MENKGRKKHIVTGEVAEIKKQEKVSDAKPVGNKQGNFLSEILKGLISR